MWETIKDKTSYCPYKHKKTQPLQGDFIPCYMTNLVVWAATSRLVFSVEGTHIGWNHSASYFLEVWLKLWFQRQVSLLSSMRLGKIPRRPYSFMSPLAPTGTRSSTPGPGTVQRVGLSLPCAPNLLLTLLALLWKSALFTDFHSTCAWTPPLPLACPPSLLTHSFTHSGSLLEVWQYWGIYISKYKNLMFNRKPLILVILPHRPRPHIPLLTHAEPQWSYWRHDILVILLHTADLVTSLRCLPCLTPSAFKFCTIRWFDFSSNTRHFRIEKNSKRQKYST